MAGVDEHGRVRSQELEAARRGTLNNRREESVRIQGAPEELLAERDRASDVLSLICGLEGCELGIRGSGRPHVELEGRTEAMLSPDDAKRCVRNPLAGIDLDALRTNEHGSNTRLARTR